MELLKSVTPGYMEEESRVETLAEMPAAVIPEGLGHSQILPRYYQSLSKLQHLHLSHTPPPSHPTPHSHRTPRKHSNLSQASPTATPLIHTRSPAFPSTLPSYRPSTSMRSSSVTANKGTFLSYLLEKSTAFAIVKQTRPNTPGRITRFAKFAKTPPKPNSPSMNMSYTGDYRGDEREGEGEALYRNGDRYIGAWIRGKRHGSGEYHYKVSELVYEGDWTEDLKHGRGTVLFPNGDKVDCLWEKDALQGGKGTVEYTSVHCRYVGELQAAKQHGQGLLSYASRASYKGAFEADRRHGYGCIQFPNGTLFEGQFEHDYSTSPGLLHLKAALTLKSDPLLTRSSTHTRGIVWSIESKEEKYGDLSAFPEFASKAAISPSDIIYRTLTSAELCTRLGLSTLPTLAGRFKAGALCGAGLAVYGDFGVYVGEFKEGLRSGYGRMAYLNEAMDCLEIADTIGDYEGQWKQDRRHGRGKMTYKNGIVYEGQYREDRRHHVCGSVQFPSGDKYTGLWVNDLMQGFGRYEEAGGNVVSGMFVQGVVGKEAALELAEGGKYEGEVRNMKAEGRGRWLYPNGDLYIGEFTEGIRAGTGKMTYTDGSEYEGEWREGMREGWGLQRTAEELYEGGWSKDHRNGRGVLRSLGGEVVFEGWWRDGVREGKGTLCDQSL